MSTTTTSRDREAGSAPGRRWRARAVFGGGRRVPHLVAGVVLVLACTAGVVGMVVLADQRSPVLVLARPVVVGHPLTAGDLRTVNLPLDAGLDVVPAERAPALLGRPVAYSLPAGAVVSPGLLGIPRIPPAGHSFVAVAAGRGQYPPELAAGATVSVVHNPGTTAVAGLGSGAVVGGGPWTAVVAAVTPTSEDYTAVISLLAADRARQVAAIPAGQLGLVVEAPGAGGW